MEVFNFSPMQQIGTGNFSPVRGSRQAAEGGGVGARTPNATLDLLHARCYLRVDRAAISAAALRGSVQKKPKGKGHSVKPLAGPERL